MTFETGTVTVTLDDEEEEKLLEAKSVLAKLAKGINTYGGKGILDEYGVYHEEKTLLDVCKILEDIADLRNAEIS